MDKATLLKQQHDRQAQEVLERQQKAVADAEKAVQSKTKALEAQIKREQNKLKALERHVQNFARVPDDVQSLTNWKPSKLEVWNLMRKDFYSDEGPPRGLGGKDYGSVNYGACLDTKDNMRERLLLLAAYEAEVRGLDKCPEYVADVEEDEGKMIIYLKRGYDQMYFIATRLKLMEH